MYPWMSFHSSELMSESPKIVPKDLQDTEKVAFEDIIDEKVNRLLRLFPARPLTENVGVKVPRQKKVLLELESTVPLEVEECFKHEAASAGNARCAFLLDVTYCKPKGPKFNIEDIPNDPFEELMNRLKLGSSDSSPSLIAQSQAGSGAPSDSRLKVRIGSRPPMSYSYPLARPVKVERRRKGGGEGGVGAGGGGGGGTGGGGGGEESGNSPGENRKWKLFMDFLGVIGAFVGIFSFWFAKVQHDSSVEARMDVLTQRGVEFVRKSVAPEVRGPRLIPRTFLVAAIQRAVEDFTTVLIYGSRGTGKTTALNMAFLGRKGVVVVQLNSSPATSVYDAVLLSLKLQLPVGYSAKALVQQVLEKAKKNLQVEPVFILCADERCRTETVREMFLFCKEFGYEKRLARFYLDVAASHIVPQIGIDPFYLRAIKVEVNDFSQEEACTYLLSEFGAQTAAFLTEEGTSMVEYALKRVGSRAYSLRRLATEVSKWQDAESVRLCIDRFADERNAAAQGSLWNFISYIDPRKRDSFFILLNSLVRGESLTLYKLARVINLKQKEVLSISAAGTPHVFEVDPFSLSLSFASSEMLNAARRIVLEGDTSM